MQSFAHEHIDVFDVICENIPDDYTRVAMTTCKDFKRAMRKRGEQSVCHALEESATYLEWAVNEIKGNQRALHALFYGSNTCSNIFAFGWLCSFCKYIHLDSTILALIDNHVQRESLYETRLWKRSPKALMTVCVKKDIGMLRWFLSRDFTPDKTTLLAAAAEGWEEGFYVLKQILGRILSTKNHFTGDENFIFLHVNNWDLVTNFASKKCVYEGVFFAAVLSGNVDFVRDTFLPISMSPAFEHGLCRIAYGRQDVAMLDFLYSEGGALSFRDLWRTVFISMNEELFEWAFANTLVGPETGPLSFYVVVVDYAIRYGTEVALTWIASKDVNITSRAWKAALQIGCIAKLDYLWEKGVEVIEGPFKYSISSPTSTLWLASKGFTMTDVELKFAEANGALIDLLQLVA